MDKVIELLSNNYSNTKVDEHFYEEVVDAITTEQGTKEYLPNGIEFKEGSFFMMLAAYVKKEGKIIVDMDFSGTSILNEISMLVNNGYNLSEKDQEQLFNLLSAASILHELEHVNQEQKRAKDSFGIESFLLRLTEDKKENVFTYTLSPSERLAEIYALTEVQQIAMALGASDEVMRVLADKKRNVIISSYDYGTGLISPTIEYCSEFKIPEETVDKIKSFSENLDFDTRVVYGLPISQAEYDSFIVTSKQR